MSIIIKTFLQHTRIIRNNIPAALLVLLTFGIVLYYGFEEKRILHAIGYLSAVWSGAFITDMVVNVLPVDAIGYPVKKPVRKELLLIVICTLLGCAFLLIRFFTNWDGMQPLLKLALIPLVLFTFPVVLGAVYLFIYKYKPRELGINLHYWYLPIVLHLVWGAITLSVAPDRSHWKEAWKEYGLIDMLVTGVITAALSEEFFRMLLQTRLGKFINSPSIAFVISSVVWALMHIPIAARDNPGAAANDIVLSSLAIVPVGLFWGYLTYRTKSMIPAILMHGFNLWGLQNM